MTTNANQPNAGTRDQAQPARAGQDQAAKTNTNTPRRDEGSRSFGSATEATPGQHRDAAGTPALMRYLDGIEENVRQVRAALGASEQGSNRPADRQDGDRRSPNESTL
jgi:hypothetical protein